MPQTLSRPSCLAGGIFSLHERGGRILTTSKDGTVTISALSDAGGSAASGAASIATVQHYDELHEGQVVKCARWREAGGGEPSVFASCGNDRQLCVVDARQSPSAGAQGLQDRSCEGWWELICAGAAGAGAAERECPEC